MSDDEREVLRARKNRTLRALIAVKEHAELVARESIPSSVPSLAKRTADAVRSCALPCEESAALVEALLAIDDAAATIKAARATDAKSDADAALGKANAAEESARGAESRRRNAFRAFLFCAASFAGALYFHEGGVALAAFACCVAVLYPELRAFVLGLRETST